MAVKQLIQSHVPELTAAIQPLSTPNLNCGTVCGPPWMWSGKKNVIANLPPSMGAEDFAWMRQERPGCYVRLGNGDTNEGSCVVHNPNYDFNDDALVYGASFWATLVEQQLPAGN